MLRTKAVFDSYLGNEESIALYKRAVALDPLRVSNARLLAQTLYLLGRFDEAIDVARSALVAIPDDPTAQVLLALMMLLRGRPDEAIKTAALVPADDENRPFADVAAIAATKGTAADRLLATFSALHPQSFYYERAEIHAWRHEPDLAFAALGRAWEGTEPSLIQLKTDPLLAPIRSDPRYGEWLRRIGFP